MTMATETKSRKAELMDAIEAKHEMKQVGQAWQWEACGVHITERCEICGLTHDKYRNGQNSPDSDKWHDSKGNELTLGEASRLDCE